MTDGNRKVFFLSLAVVLGWAAVIFVLLFGSCGVSPSLFLGRLTDVLYLPSHNACLVDYLGRFPAYAYFYLVLTAAAVTIALLRLGLKLQHVTLFRCFFTVGLAVYFLLVGFQTANQFKTFVTEWQALNQKTLAQKNELLFGKTYTFARFCLQNRPGYHKADLVTDLDLSRDPGMYMHRALSYHLYPIDIRGVHGQDPVDTAVFFYKKQAAENRPGDFPDAAVFDEDSLIAAKGGL